MVLRNTKEVVEMAKKTTRNNKLLLNAKENTSPKVYSLLLSLVNEDKEELAEIVLKIDYLLEYASRCMKQRDFEEAKEGLRGAKTRIDRLKEEAVDTEHLEYLYEGIKEKANHK